MRAVFDASVIAAAVCWNGEPYLCLVKMARRQVWAFGTQETLAETRNICAQLIRQKFAISSNEFAVEINLAAAIIRSLDVDHVPMDLAAVAIISFFISLARSEMKRARDFLVKQNITHRL